MIPSMVPSATAVANLQFASCGVRAKPSREKRTIASTRTIESHVVVFDHPGGRKFPVDLARGTTRTDDVESQRPGVTNEAKRVAVPPRFRHPYRQDWRAGAVGLAGTLPVASPR